MIRITNNQIISGISGIIYRMHPYHAPENMDVIMKKVNEWLDNKKDNTGHVDADWKLFEYKSHKDFEKELKIVLMDILEFRQLNISRKLKDQGVTDLNDDRNSGFCFTAKYDKNTKDKKYSDFIDLDACIRNIAGAIIYDVESSEDCFLCKFAERYSSMNPSNCEQCNTCILNPKFKFNRICHPMSLKPLKDWTEEEKEKYNLD